MRKIASFILLALALVTMMTATPMTIGFATTDETNSDSNENDASDTNGENEESPPEESTNENENGDEPVTNEEGTVTPLAPQTLTPTEKEASTVTCPDGITEVIDMKDCPDIPEPTTAISELPSQCAEGTTALECLGDLLGEPDCGDMTPLECLNDKLNNGGNGETVPPVIEEEDNKPNPYCDLVPEDYKGSCWDRKDYSEDTGLYSCNDGSHKERWQDCKDSSGYDYWKHKNKNHDEDRKERHDHFKKIVHNVDIHKTVINQNEFPDVDIIGLSIRDTGEAMVCLMEIDGDNIQCQEFGVPNDRINDNIWRIIETDKNDDYDNGNTGSEDVDDAISAIKDYDFDELEDLDNHEFDVDLTALGINPNGEGLVCLVEDQSDEGTALCEPFKVDSGAISGQITEITEMG
jgi:hypothetical protein